MSGKGHGGPARGYSWPAFAPGNEIRVTHGAYSARRVDPIAAELAAALVEARPDLDGHGPAVWAWARAEARCLLLAEHFADGMFDTEGNVRAGMRELVSFERLAADLRSRLGLDPRSQADLARSRAEAARTAVDLEAVRARGRASAIEGRSDDASS